jgi:GDP-L-fucose synthase
VGTGADLTIKELAELVRDIVYPDADIGFDASKPDGTPRKLLDMTRLHSLGWHHRIQLPDGVRATYEWFLQHRQTTQRRAAVVSSD